MELKTLLLYNTLAELIVKKLRKTNLDFTEIADTAAISVLSEIQKCVKDDSLDDFDAMERIVSILEKFNISSGNRHDFG